MISLGYPELYNLLYIVSPLSLFDVLFRDEDIEVDSYGLTIIEYSPARSRTPAPSSADEDGQTNEELRQYIKILQTQLEKSDRIK